MTTFSTKSDQDFQHNRNLEHIFFFRHGILILSTLFFILRLALIGKSPDLISTPDELYQGYIAFEWLHGLKASLFHYQGDAYTAGALVTGTLAAPFFSLFGAKLFALKLVPLLFSTGSVFILMTILKKQFNRETALIAGLLFLFSPFGFSALSVMALGSHPESIFFCALMLAVFFHSGTQRTIPAALAFGMFAGISCWFDQINVPAALLCFALVLSRKNSRNFLMALAGLFAGFIPWFLFNVKHDWLGAEFLSEITHLALSSLSLKLWGGELFNLLTVYFPQSLFFQSFFGEIYAVGAYAGFGLFVSKIFRKNRILEERFSFFTLFPVVFLFVFAYFRGALNWHSEWTPFRFRYFVPFFYFMIIPSAIWGGFFRRGKFLIGGLLILGLLGQYEAFSSPASISATKIPGYYLESPSRVRTHGCESDKNYFFYCEDYWTSNPTPAEKVLRAESLPPFLRANFYMRWGRYLAENEFISWEQKIEIPSEIPEPFISFLYHGVGAALNWSNVSLETGLNFIHQQPEPFQPFLLLGLGSRLLAWTSITGAPATLYALEPVFELDSQVQDWILRGIGQSLLFTIESPDYFKDRMNIIPLDAKYEKQVLWGMGWKLRLREGPLSLLEKFPAAQKQFILQGYKAAQAWLTPSKSSEASNAG